MTAMASSGTAVVTLPSDTEILITREFAAPKALVYRAWTTPELIKAGGRPSEERSRWPRWISGSGAGGGTR